MARQVVIPSGALPGTLQIPGWEKLKRYEQEILLLVDVLGKAYLETVRIMDLLECDIARTLASGRQKLIHHSNLKSEMPGELLRNERERKL